MPKSSRGVKLVVSPRPVVEGAGVRLKRLFPLPDLDLLDPFLLLDHFGSDDPEDYLAGFPTHPHRGIETVTILRAGAVRHRDSTGRTGVLRAGDVQWMTAGRGILHEEMPEPVDGKHDGLQLWVNLPAKLKMSPPRYQDYRADSIPEIDAENGVRIRLFAGNVGGVRGPVTGIAAEPSCMIITVPGGQTWTQGIPRGHTAFAYLFEGSGWFGGARGLLDSPRLIVFEDGDSVSADAGPGGATFLLAAGRPLKEPVVRHGPFVMNTEAEIVRAIHDLKAGTFIKSPVSAG